MSHAPPSRDIPKSVAAAFLGLTALILGMTARSYLTGGAPYGDDNSSHISWFVHIANIFRSGQFDFHFAQQNVGVPMFASYHPLPGLWMGTLHLITSSFMDATTLFKGSLVGMWMVMPTAWYIGGRWMGMTRTEAFAFGLLSIGIQDFNNYGLTMKSILYKGLYAQLYGMLFLPLALGSIYRYVVREEGTAQAPIICFWLTFLSHAFFGIFVGIASLLMLLVKAEGLPRRAMRLFLVYGVTLLLLLFWVVPLLHHVGHVGGLPWRTEVHNGYKWNTTIQHFIQGMMFDEGRWPWLTSLVFVGLLLGLVRIRHRLTRWVLLTTVFAALMYLGRTFWGPAYTSIPLHRELNVSRYLSGLHFCGILLAALAFATLLRWMQEQAFFPKVADFSSKFSVFLLIPLVGFFLFQRTQHWQTSLKTFPLKESAFQEVAKVLKKGKGRYVANSVLGTTSHFHRDLLASLSRRPHLRSFGMTFHASLSNYYLNYYDFSPTLSRLYNIHYLVLNKAKLSPKRRRQFKQVFQVGTYTVYQSREKYGYFGFVHVPFTVKGKAKQLRRVLHEITPTLYRHSILPKLDIPPEKKRFTRWLEPTPLKPKTMITSANLTVTADGKETLSLFGQSRPFHKTTTAQFQRWLTQQRRTTIRSKVLTESVSMHTYKATVDVKGPQDFLLFKMNYFPYWHAYKGNKELPLLRVAPNFMAVMLPKGRHTIRFEYKNPSMQKILFLLSLLWVLLIAFRGLPTMKMPRLLRDDIPPRTGGLNTDVDPVGNWIKDHYGTSEDPKAKG